LSGGANSVEDLKSNAELALASYQRAIEVDDRLTAAYSGRAELYLRIAQLGFSDSLDAIASGIKAAGKALSLDQHNPAAITAQKQLRKLQPKMNDSAG